MTWQFIVNQTPANGGLHMWNFISTLKLAGWTMPDAGDGGAGRGADVYNATNANVLYAWARMQAPDGNRELCIQRGSDHYLWWIKYSRSAHFTTGGSSTVMPTATDETNIWGSTSAGSHLLTFTAGGYRSHCGADSAAPYGAYFLTIPNGGSDTNACIFVMDPVVSADALDPDPVVFCRCHQNEDIPRNYFWVANAGVGSAGSCALLGASYMPIGALRLTVSTGTSLPAYDAAGSLGTNPFSGKDDIVPVFWARPINAGGAPHGWKGIGTVMKQSGVVHTPGESMSVVGVRDYIYLSGVVFPWDGSVPVI